MSLCYIARKLNPMKYLVFVLLLLPAVAKAQTFAAPPFTFVAGTLADASQMMANFQAFVNNGNAVSVDLQSRIKDKESFPSGTIAFFNLTACPTAWTLQTAFGTRFIRGLDLGRGKDPGNTLAQLETGQNQGHKHFVTGSLGRTGVEFHATKGKVAAPGVAFTSGNFITNSSQPVNSGSHGSTVRPDNISLLMCRKN